MVIKDLLFAAVAATAADGLVYEPCELSGVSGGPSLSAECFTVSVPEDRNLEDGTQIGLSAARIKANNRDADGDPLIMIAGGPGQSALESFIPHVRALRPVRQNHDIILVDQRGTGGSNALRCPDYDMESDVSPAQAAEQARRCLDELGVDPRHYTTAEAVLDLEVVREALGIEQWHVYGVSYGSRVGLEYLRHAPERVATLTLDGVVPADEVLGPMIAPFAQQAVDRMLARCADDAACREAFPDLSASLDRLLNRLSESPQAVSLRHPRTHQTTEVRLDRDRVAQVIRFAAYQPELLSLIPLMIHRAAVEGDWAPLAGQWLTLGEAMGDSISVGMHYAVICSEDVPFIDEEDAIAGSNSFLEQDPMELLKAVCSDWPVTDGDRREAVHSDRPVLLLSGELDPVTPPSWGEQAAATLSNSRHITLKGKGHNVVHLGCVPFLLRDLMAGTAPDALDAECLDNMRPTPFFIDFHGPSA